MNNDYYLNDVKLADLAKEIGDYRFANYLYARVLEKEALVTEELKEKLVETERLKWDGKSILSFDGWKLSKSSYVKGNQCLKYLYLDKYKKKERTPVDEETQERFNRGHTFEDVVREHEFPGGINIKEKVGNFGYFNSYTNYLLNQSKHLTLYEATIIEDEVLVMCDVLVKSDDGFVDIYEIKSSTQANIAISNDLKLQYAVCKKRFKDKLRSFNLILRVEDDEPKWEIENKTDELVDKTTLVGEVTDKFKKVLNGREPEIAMGDHCNSPYKCEFIDYCEKRGYMESLF